MDRILDLNHRRALFSDRAVVLVGLAPGMTRDLAAQASESVVRGDAMPCTRAEYDALSDALAPGAGARKGSR